MTLEVLMKGFYALVFSVIFMWMVFDRGGSGDADSERQRYLPYIPGSLLPLILLGILSIALIFSGAEGAMEITLDFCFGVFLHICLYYLLLMPALPFLRRHISARACGVLWMLPNYLYLTQMSFMKLSEPRWVVEAPLSLVQLLLVLWLAGFTSVLVWKMISHLIFRARILRPAAPVTDRLVLAVWEREVEAARFRKPKFCLVTSPAVRTPLSVGLFRRSVRVVLPERDYTPEELGLIFRHELVHIGREDAWNKFFLVFCTALCWFNPLMWLAMDRSAGDLELSCDETVLLGSDGAEKRQYAALLLNTAGDSRGFTSCLSASAASLRYRLKQVMDPRKKHCGALLVGLVFFLLFMSCGYVALAYGGGTGAELLFLGAPEDYSLMEDKHVSICTGGNVNTMVWRDVSDGAALLDYVSGLELCSLTGNYAFDEAADQNSYAMTLIAAGKGVEMLVLQGHVVKLVPLHEDTVQTLAYYVPAGIDEAYLQSLLQ